MKKAFLLATTILMVAITGCGKEATSEPTQQVAETKSESAIVEEGAGEVKRDLPEGNYEEKGEGVVYLATAAGTTEEGNVPVIYISADTSMQQIGLNSTDFNASALSFVYVDGVLLAKEQLGDSQKSLNLEKAQLTEGVHTVEVVQYTNDDTTADMITYRKMSYEIKLK